MSSEAPGSSADSGAWDEHWSQFADSAEQNPAQRWRRTLVLRALELRAGDRLLDVGSGQGDLARAALATPGVELVGFELSQIGVDVAAAKVPAGHFHQVDLLGPDPIVPGRGGWATKVSCSEVLEHVDEPARLLRNALVHAGPRAHVVVTVPAGPVTAFDRHIGHRRHYDRRSLRSLLIEAGLEVNRADAAGFPVFNLYRLAVLARGRRLVDDVSASDGGTSRTAAMAMRTFERLMPWSTRSGRLGWQLLATATVP